MYEIDWLFKKDLKAIDPKLGCFFNRDTENVVVTYERATGQPVPIYVVKNEDGSFRVPNRLDLEAIQAGDLSRENMKTRLAKTAKYMEDYRRKAERDRKDNIRNMTKDDKLQLSRAFSRQAGYGSKTHPYRKITPRPRGKVF